MQRLTLVGTCSGFLILVLKFLENIRALLKKTPVSPERYFNQRLLKFNLYFATYSGSTFSVRSMFEQHHLHLSMKFAMQKIKADALTAQTVKNILKKTIERFVASENTFSF